MKKKVLLTAVVSVLLLQFSFHSCTPEGYADENEAVLAFSADTVSFDTVFTTVATPTKMVVVYNRTSRDMLLSQVTLEGGRASRFRINVDGDTSMVARNIEIMAGDSIFIFVQANINPNDQTSPFVVEDAIAFSNGQRLPLSAWGRNAVYHLPTDTLHYADGTYPLDAYGNPYAYSVIDCANWRHDMPHVIIGYAVVDSRNTLNLTAGDELYFYNDAVLWVYDSATLDVRGTAEQPVLFTSVRKDGWYSFLPGQWGQIWLSAGSKDNVIDHAVIEKGCFGLVVDTNVGPNPTLMVSNTELRHMSYTGIQAQGARIVGNNLLVYQCGTAALWLRAGGDYSFTSSTFGGYWRYGGRQNPTVVLQNCYVAVGNVTIPRDLVRADFTDCIIWGTYPDTELLEQQVDEAAYSSRFIHSIVKGGEWDVDPLFVDPDENDYHLQDGSPAAGIGYQFEN
ncbi:MAG: hypothetical protein IKR83_04745 [Bacteroidales bacterium]|nr:hypothetical protein [Bacteroidales bacterium]